MTEMLSRQLVCLLQSQCSLLLSLQQRHLAAGLPAIQPNLYEMAALTQELDTQVTYGVYMADFVNLLGKIGDRKVWKV